MNESTIKSHRNNRTCKTRQYRMCPICGIKLRLGRYWRHGIRKHNLDLYKEELRLKKEARKLIAPEDRSESDIKVLEAEYLVKVQRERSDNITFGTEPLHRIKNFKKFGTPQDKYRYGSFGLSSMEANLWRK